MGTINLRVDDDLKERSFAVFKKLGITPSEALRQTLEYVADRGMMPFKPILLAEDEAALVAVVRERLANPLPGVKVSLSDL